jgi:hypothetical protein
LSAFGLAGCAQTPAILIDDRANIKKHKRLLQNCFLCHPERSEGSQPPVNMRFFASLRMTKWGPWRFLQEAHKQLEMVPEASIQSTKQELCMDKEGGG